MSLLYKAVAGQVVMLKLFLSSDHVTAATGKTVVITISKNGGAFGNPNAGATNATEVSSGWYKVTLDATDTATEGDLVVRGTATSCDDTERVFRVHLPPNFAAASIDSNGRVDVIKIAGTTQTARDIGASVLLSSGTGTGQVSLSSGLVALSGTQTFNMTGSITGNLSGSVGSVTGAVGSVTGNVGGNVTGSVGSVTGLTVANLDAAISTRLATSGYTAPDNATITLIAGYTDSIESRLPAALVGGRMDSNLGAVNADATAAANLAKTTRAVARGTVGSGATTTSITTSAFTPAGAAADQFKGRIVTFDADTTTTALRGQSTDITASSNAAAPTLTVTALSTTPASGDTFSVT